VILHLRCSFCMMVRTYTSATFGGSERRSITAGPSNFACSSVEPPRVSIPRGSMLLHSAPSESGPCRTQEQHETTANVARQHRCAAQPCYKILLAA